MSDLKGRPDSTAEILGVGLIVLLLATCVWLTFFARPAEAACEHYAPNPPHEPTGIKGCEVYGEGTASQWGGPGVARNDCVWPWTACQTIRILSLDTGKSIVVTPTMYCDCYTGTEWQRIVDLDTASVLALGLDPARGLHAVWVEPVREGASSNTLPDTAMER